MRKLNIGLHEQTPKTHYHHPIHSIIKRNLRFYRGKFSFKCKSFKKGIDYEVIPRIFNYPVANPIERYLPTKRYLYRFRIYKNRYKIIIKVLKRKVVILDIIHTSRDPKDISKLRTTDYS